MRRYCILPAAEQPGLFPGRVRRTDGHLVPLLRGYRNCLHFRPHGAVFPRQTVEIFQALAVGSHFAGVPGGGAVDRAAGLAGHSADRKQHYDAV